MKTKIIAILALYIIVNSCSHHKWAVKNKDYICKQLCVVDVDTIVNFRDTTIVLNVDTIVNIDTLSGVFIVECDSLRRAYVRLLDSKGKITYQFKDNVIKVFAIPELVRLHYKKIVTLTEKIKQITTAKLQPYEVVRYRVPFWVWLLFGAMTFLIVSLILK